MVNYEVFYDQLDDEKKNLNTANTIILLVICVFGLLANTFVMFIIIRLKEYKKSMFQWYVVQLAVADTLFLLSIPFEVSQHMRTAWIYPEWMCTVDKSILFLNYFASILLLTVVSINRYIAICHPFSSLQRKLTEPRYVAFVSVIIWGVSLAMTIPAMMHSTLYGTKPNCKCEVKFPKPMNTTDHCNDPEPTSESSMLQEYEQSLSTFNFNPQNTLFPDCFFQNMSVIGKVYLILMFAAFFLIPLLITTVCYGLIAKRLRQPSPSSNVSQSSHCKTSRVTEERRKVTVTCAALVCCFIICWLPYHAVNLAKIVHIQTSTPIICDILPDVAVILGFLNSAINPCLYTFLSKGFRHRMQRIQSTTEVQWITNTFRRYSQPSLSA